MQWFDRLSGEFLELTIFFDIKTMKYYVYGPGKDQSKSGVINGEITPDRHIWFRKRNDKGKIDQFTGKLT